MSTETDDEPGTPEQEPIDAPDGQEPDLGVSDPPPEAVAELAIACVDYVERALGVTLDFTDETLPVLDHYLITARGDLAARPEVARVLARTVGAYFGEVLRHEFGGFWRIPLAENVHDWQWCSRAVFLALNPIGVAFDALYGGDGHDGPGSRLRVLAEDRGLVDARLAAMPPVPEAEYYRLTTRIEVIEVATIALRARMAETGYDGIEFDEGDYAGEEGRL
jgi:hypothetical protein